MFYTSRQSENKELLACKFNNSKSKVVKGKIYQNIMYKTN